MPREFVELNPVTGKAIRVFRTKRAACRHQVEQPAAAIVQMPLDVATGEIRRQVYDRDEGECVRCGQELIYERGRWNSMEMDEKVSKGDLGEVSVANGQSLCHNCHTAGVNAKHQRNPQWTQGALA